MTTGIIQNVPARGQLPTCCQLPITAQLPPALRVYLPSARVDLPHDSVSSKLHFMKQALFVGWISFFYFFPAAKILFIGVSGVLCIVPALAKLPLIAPFS